jgi:hypothetical protein
MWALCVIAFLLLSVGSVGEGWAEDALGTRPLLTIAGKDLRTILPADCHVLVDPHSIEQFLDGLDESPPNWGLIYGRGHRDPDHDERLFRLNRERDAKRAGNPLLRQLIAFAWVGELSRYDANVDGFRVAIGPMSTPTRWGVVRFKYEDLPGELVAKASVTLRGELERRFAQGISVDIIVAMTGQLIPDESVVYDFSHDHAGLGVIMPVVRVERLDYLLTNK